MGYLIHLTTLETEHVLEYPQAPVSITTLYETTLYDRTQCVIATA